MFVWARWRESERILSDLRKHEANHKEGIKVRKTHDWRHTNNQASKVGSLAIVFGVEDQIY